MKNSLQFEVNKNIGQFIYPKEPFNILFNELDMIQDARRIGEIGDKRYLSILDEFIQQQPDFLDAHAHLTYAYARQGKPKKTLEAALAGLAIANRLIPDNFNGQIEWLCLENRPFLRVMHGAILAYVRLRRHTESVKLMEKMLHYNPNDNLGVRYLFGSELLRDGHKTRAQQVFSDNAESYPPYYYELAFTHLMNKEWVLAATALRRGFCANSYIAEIIAGNPSPHPLPIWHESNFAEPEIADEYMAMYGNLWPRDIQFLAFVRWLFNHPKVMAERAAIMACSEALLWEQDADNHLNLLNKQHKLITKIDDSLSAQIAIKRKDRDGKALYPWTLHMEYHP